MVIPANATLIAPIRNVSGSLASDLTHLSGVLSSVFAVLKVVLVESDSTDSTLDIAHQLMAANLVHHVRSLGKLSDRYPIRCDRIAIARNSGLAVSREHYSTDFYVFADLDGVNKSITVDGVLSCFRYSGWSAMVANQYGRYYDIWALRHSTWCPGDCWVEYNALLPLFGDKIARWLAVGSRQIAIDSDLPPILVRSGFGGLGIYRSDSVRGSAWSGLTSEGTEVVDWCSFNNSVVGQIYINPKLQNSGPSEHYVDPPI